MSPFHIGAILESFRLPFPEAIKTAASLGIEGIQAYATYGELSPKKLTEGKRKEFLRMVKDNGMVISALCGDLGMGFGDASKNKQLVEDSKAILDLAKELETNIVTTHIGVVPKDKNHPRYKIMQDACGQLAEYADKLDAHFAVETGPETSETLCAFLDDLHSTGVAVNLDPANLVMVTGDDPVAAVHRLKKYIVHTHAKDGRLNYIKDPEKIYGIVQEVKEDKAVEDPAYIELPLGEGQVPFPQYLNALKEIGYHGFLTIEREVGENPAGDIKKAVDFLNTLMK